MFTNEVVLAAVYCRISSDRSGEGLGVERQREDCMAKAAQLGWTVVGEPLIDNDVSAFSGKKRDGYERLLDGLADGTYTAVIAWHPDRLHRSLTELLPFIKLIERTKAKVHTCQAGEYDLSTPSGRMVAKVVGSVAEHESEHKAARAARKHLQLAEQGKPSGGGVRALGYAANGIDVVPEEADALRQAASDIIGGMSLTKATRNFNATLGTKTTKVGLKTRLCSPRLIGMRTHKGKEYGAKWDAILKVADQRKVHAILHAPERAQARKALYALSGLLDCATCHLPMVSAKARRYNGKALRDLTPGTPNPIVQRYKCSKCFSGVLASMVEERLITLLSLALDRPQIDEGALPSDAAALARVQEIEEQQKFIATEWAAKRLSNVAFSAADKQLTADLAEAQSEIVTVATSVWENHREALFKSGEGEKFLAAWPTMDADDQRAMLSHYIERVEISRGTKAAQRKADVGRVSITWRAGNALTEYVMMAERVGTI